MAVPNMSALWLGLTESRILQFDGVDYGAHCCRGALLNTAAAATLGFAPKVAPGDSKSEVSTSETQHQRAVRLLNPDKGGVAADVDRVLLQRRLVLQGSCCVRPRSAKLFTPQCRVLLPPRRLQAGTCQSEDPALPGCDIR